MAINPPINISRSPPMNLLQSLQLEGLQLSDHFIIVTKTGLSKPKTPRKETKSRDIKGMDLEAFKLGLTNSSLIRAMPSTAEELVVLGHITRHSFQFLISRRLEPGNAFLVGHTPRGTARKSGRQKGKTSSRENYPRNFGLSLRETNRQKNISSLQRHCVLDPRNYQIASFCTLMSYFMESKLKKISMDSW